MSDATVNNDRKMVFFFATIIFLLALMTFSKTLENDFVWDSKTYLFDDIRVQSFDSAKKFFTESTNSINLSSGESYGKTVNYYRPLTGLFHFFERKVFGVNPYPYKLTNLILNAVLSVLIFFLLFALSGNGFLSFLSAAIFSVNPARSEIVYWVYSDSYLFFSIFSILSIINYLNDKYLFSLACAALAFLFQEAAVLIFPTLIAYEFFQNDKNKKYLLLALHAILLTLYFLVRSKVVGGIESSTISFFDRFNYTSVLIAKYIKIFFKTDADVAVYQFVQGKYSFINNEIFISYLIVIAIAILGVLIYVKSRKQMFYYFWFFIWISPGFNIGGVGHYFMAEKTLNLASLAPCFFIVMALSALFRNKAIVASLVAVIVIFHASESYARGSSWRNTETYLTRAIAFSPEFELLQIALAEEYLRLKKYDDAKLTIDKISEINKYSSYKYSLSAELYFRLGTIALENGEVDQALNYYKRSINFEKNQKFIYTNMATIYRDKKDYERAINYYRMAISLNRNDFLARYNLAVTFELSGQYDLALNVYSELMAGNTSFSASARERVLAIEAMKSNNSKQPIVR